MKSSEAYTATTARPAGSRRRDPRRLLVATRLATAEDNADDIVDHMRALADAIVRKTRLNRRRTPSSPTTEAAGQQCSNSAGWRMRSSSRNTGGNGRCDTNARSTLKISSALAPGGRERPTIVWPCLERIRADADVSHQDDFLGIMTTTSVTCSARLSPTLRLISKPTCRPKRVDRLARALGAFIDHGSHESPDRRPG